MAREELTQDAKRFIERLIAHNPRAAILVSAVFMEQRLLTLLTTQIATGRNGHRKEIRSFLDEKFTIGPLVRMAAISNLISRPQVRSFNRLLQERNRLAHKYSAWKRFTEQDHADYRKKWKPDCMAVLEFMKETTIQYRQ